MERHNKLHDKNVVVITIVVIKFVNIRVVRTKKGVSFWQVFVRVFVCDIKHEGPHVSEDTDEDRNGARFANSFLNGMEHDAHVVARD